MTAAIVFSLGPVAEVPALPDVLALPAVLAGQVQAPVLATDESVAARVVRSVSTLIA